MVPNNVAYDICRHYINDFKAEVDPALVKLADGYRRARNLAGLTSCSQHHDRAKHTITDWRFLRQIEAFFKKNATLSNNDVCFQAASDSFLNSEVLCSETNVRLHKYMKNLSLLDEDLRVYIGRMERFIVDVLGDYDRFLEALPLLVKVTPGATSYSARLNSLPQLKMKMRLYATRRASPYLLALYHKFGFGKPRIRLTHSNRVELVPKNWKTHRTIACEPEGNLPLQLAFDTYAKGRFRHFGIDLSDQSANQKRAKHASIHNDYVTVDFQSASDTIAYNTVSWLFPVDWFKFLADVRTPSYRGVFGDGVYAKFSSMGNGSTFAIETLLFAAACKAVGSSNFLVYGDDVIIEKALYEDFLRLTRFLGFSINEQKTFTDGPFRESCGFDAYNGVDVTPVYIRDIDSRKAILCHLINSIRCVATDGGELESYLAGLIQEFELPLVPHQQSTIAGISIEPAEARRLGLLTRKHPKFLTLDSFKAYVPLSRKRNFVDSRGYYLWFLYKNSQVLFSGPWETSQPRFQASETSWVPVFEHKYVRRRVGWFPAEATPDHITSWSDLLIRALNQRRS